MEQINDALKALDEARLAWGNAPSWGRTMAKGWADPLLAALDTLETKLRQLEKMAEFAREVMPQSKEWSSFVESEEGQKLFTQVMDEVKKVG